VLKKVLVVDDSVAETKLLQSFLVQGGYWPVGLYDPTRIEETIEQEHPSLILLDVVMPLRNGFQACRELKSQAAYQEIPVILVTAKNAPSDRLWGQEQGANGYVAKPFTPKELLSEVAKFD
jgi:twitching motility two-component system response regulator PilH